MVADMNVFQAMAEVGMPLLIHGEVTTAGVDIFDKEARFIEEVIKVGGFDAPRSFVVVLTSTMTSWCPC